MNFFHYKALQADYRVRLCGFLEQNVRRVFYLHKLPAEMHKAGLDKAQRCADRLSHGKEPLKPMAHKPAYDGVDAVFVNGRRFIHDLGIAAGIFITGDDAHLVCKRNLGVRDNGCKEQSKGFSTMAADYPADMEPHRVVFHFYAAVIASVDSKAGGMSAARACQLVELDGIMILS